MILNKGDIMFAPDGTKYYTDIPELYDSNVTAGVGVSFDLLDSDGEPIKIDAPLSIIAHDDKGDIYKQFEHLMYAFHHLGTCSMKYKGELYTLLDRLFSPEDKEHSLRDSYSEILEAMFYTSGGGDMNSGFVTEDSESDGMAGGATGGATGGSSSGSTAPEAGGGSGDRNHSGTNVQVEGIDEGDIVKTDGRYIYVLQDRSLIILEADGADTEELSKIWVGGSENYDSYTESEDGKAYVYEMTDSNPYAMYVADGRVIVLSSYYSYYEEYKETGEWFGDDEQKVVVDIYDVSDPTEPKLEASLSQSGYSVDDRMSDGKLYLVSSWYCWNVDDSDPETYVPAVYAGEEKTLIPAEDIAIMPGVRGRSYTVISVIDIAGGELLDSAAMLGLADCVYMSGGTVYITGSRWDESKVSEYTESVYNVTEYVSGSSTCITGFDITESGTLEIRASATVRGTLINQFAMDEHNGNLRLVTTVSDERYSVYEDPAYGWRNYRWDGGGTSNALWVLGEDMQLIGSVEELAEGERVYSVRFAGDTGYFCTFRNVDPLFTVDLSDPSEPVVMSELKISGFSEYLHVWDGGLLFGLGMEADEETGWTDNMKMVMFDVSDPNAVFASAETDLDGRWSEALYDHKAVTVLPEKNIIGFQMDETYCIFGWNGSGFELRAEIENPTWYSVRGFYIGEYFYVVSADMVTVFALDTLEHIASIVLAMG